MKTEKQHSDDIHKMEEELVTMEAKLEASYSQMGKNLLELVGNEQRNINKLVDSIIRKKRRLSEAKNEKQCLSCMMYNNYDSNFCKFCGTKLPEPQSNTKEKYNGKEEE